MNYAFGVEFVEVDPLNLGTETLDGETSSDKAEMVKHLAVDKSRTVALHGTAILSRFPLRDVKLIPYKQLVMTGISIRRTFDTFNYSLKDRISDQVHLSSTYR